MLLAMNHSEDTTFLQRTTDAAKKHKGKVAVTAGTGLTSAAVIWMYMTFATTGDVAKLRESQQSQWQAYQRQVDAVNTLRLEIAEIRGQNRAYEMVLYFVNTNR
jgi:hypothetical protein